jgi:hypothetical protein
MYANVNRTQLSAQGIHANVSVWIARHDGVAWASSGESMYQDNQRRWASLGKTIFFLHLWMTYVRYVYFGPSVKYTTEGPK